VHKEHSAGLRDFVYDQQGHLLGEYNAAGVVQEFVWLGDMPVAVIAGSVASPLPLLVYADHLNAPRVLVDKTDAARWRWISEPFGTTQPEQAPAGLSPITFNLRFPGQYYDSESGLSYNYFRDYDATTGRYVQSDPIGLDGGINTYAYVGANPIGNFDPQGLQTNCVASPFAVVCQRTPPVYANPDYPPGVGPNQSVGTSSSSSSSSTSKRDGCDCSQYPSRTQAYFDAAAIAKISQEWYMVGWDAYNKPQTKSAQIEYTKFRQRIGKEPYGWRSPHGGELVEHPADDDHPCPHFHAKPNLAARSIPFPYDPSKP